MNIHQDPWTAALATAVEKGPIECDELTAEDIWRSQGGELWRAKRFVGQPTFYPVYRFQDLYSYWPLPLILAKGSLSVDLRVADFVKAPDFIYTPTEATVDTEVHRIGGPGGGGKRTIRTPEEYVRRISDAMKIDAAVAESNHPGFKNIILCGGRDSLNLLFLRWSNETIVASAPPNYGLVKEFVARHKLDFEVVRLRDAMDPLVLQREILANACRTDLRHARWGADLCDLAEQHDHKVLFWKGQLADLYATPKWVTLAHPVDSMGGKLRKAYARVARMVPPVVRQPMERVVLESGFRRNAWLRSAMHQGAHVSIVRAVTGCLTLSAYHGVEMREVFDEVDLPRAATRDIRPEVGALLRGQPVDYPVQNPGPELSVGRAGLHTVDRFRQALAAWGIAEA